MTRLNALVALTAEQLLAKLCPLRFAESDAYGRRMLEPQHDLYDCGPGLRVTSYETPGTAVHHLAATTQSALHPPVSPWASNPNEVKFLFVWPPTPDAEKRGNPLPLVSGESGSGKTWEMLHLQPAQTFSIVIALSGDVRSELEAVAKGLGPGEDWAKARDSHVIRTIKARVESALESRLGAAFAGFAHHRFACGLHVVVDEVGACPQFLRGLISARGSVGEALCERFAEVTMVAGGTGADIDKPDVGTNPAAFHRFTVPPVESNFFANIVQASLPSEGQVFALAKGVSTSPLLRHLLQNRRLARSAAVLLVSLPAASRTSLVQVVAKWPSWRSDAFADLMLPQFLAVFSVLAYRNLNGLQKVRVEDLLQMTEKALFYVLFAGRPRAVTAGRFPNGGFWEEVNFCKSLITGGVLTLRATCDVADETVGVPHRRDVLQFYDVRQGKEHTRYVYTLADSNHRGCFRVTGAQAMMLQLCYGLSLGAITWTVFESIVAAFAHALATALQTPVAERARHLRGGVLAGFLNETLATKDLPERFLVGTATGDAGVVSPPHTAALVGTEPGRVRLADPVPSAEAVTITVLTGRVGTTFCANDTPTRRAVPTISVTADMVPRPDSISPVPRIPRGPSDVAPPIVLVSAPQSPFADVTLIFPGHSVFLFQAKHLEETTLNETKAVAELFKMGFEPVRSVKNASLARRMDDVASKIRNRLTSGFVGVYFHWRGREGAASKFETRVYFDAAVAGYQKEAWQSLEKELKPRALTQRGAYGLSVLRQLMWDYNCPIAFPVIVTKDPAGGVMKKLRTCRCPERSEPKDDDRQLNPRVNSVLVPVLWWDSKDLYPVRSDPEGATAKEKKRHRSDSEEDGDGDARTD